MVEPVLDPQAEVGVLDLRAGEVETSEARADLRWCEGTGGSGRDADFPSFWPLLTQVAGRRQPRGAIVQVLTPRMLTVQICEEEGLGGNVERVGL